MGKLTIIISDEVEERLRVYIAKQYPTEIYGKLSEVVELALKEFLEKEKQVDNVLKPGQSTSKFERHGQLPGDRLQ